MDFKDLDAETRQLMLQELAADIARGELYYGKVLTQAGRDRWPSLLSDAFTGGDIASLTSAVSPYIAPTEQYVRGGVERTRKTASNAAERLAEGEFNRFYIRAVCLRAIGLGAPEVSIYRAKFVDNPRQESEAKLGTHVSASAVLQDLRANQGVDTALGIPPGPNSGLSVRLL